LRPLSIFACLWAGAIVPNMFFGQCGKPVASLALPPEGGGLPGFVFNKASTILPGSFAPEIQVYTRPDGTIQIWKKYPNGDAVLVWEGMASGLPAELQSMCGPDWYSQNFPPVSKSPARQAAESARAVAAAAASPSSGQAAQGFAVADVNGDGFGDTISVSSVQLRAADGSLLSTKPLTLGFTPDPTTQIVVADFNRDGKLDLAFNNYGPPPAQGSVVILLGNGDGTFGAPKSFPAGSNPLSLAAADFNDDGTIDLAAGNRNGAISILPGNGDGTFAAPVSVAIGEDALGNPQSILALDLNGDGRPDLEVANNGDKSISVLLNTGGGKFGPPSITALPFDPNYLAFGDFNHDGKLDLAAASYRSNAMVILLGNGGGTFHSPAAYATGNFAQSIGVEPLDDGTTLLVTADGITGDVLFTVVTPQGVVGAPPLDVVGGQPTAVAAADLNGDGMPDVVLTGASSDVSVLIAQAGGQFKAAVGYSLGQPSPLPQALVIGDLNGDGKPDVITANAGTFTSPGSVSVLLGNGDGTLKPPASTNVNQTAQSLALGDFNRDGKPDVAVAAFGSIPGAGGSDPGGVAVLLGKGDGTFQPPATLTVSGLHPEAVAAADLNGDGKLDLAVVLVCDPALTQPSTLAIFLGQGDGTFAPARTFPLKATGGTLSAVAIGDWNGDGKPDVAAVSNFGQQLDILLGDGAGGFLEAATTPTTEPGAQGLAVADLDGDGKLDLIVAHCCGESDGTYLLGNGDGTFQPEQHLVSGSSPTGVAVSSIGATGPGLVFSDQGGTMTGLSFPGPPPVLAVSTGPASGGGASQTFTFVFSHSEGYQNLAVVDVLINSVLDGRSACYVAFVPSGASSGSLFLVDDAGDAGGPYQGIVLPGSGAVSNSQCAIRGAGSSASGSGNTLTLTLAITFKAGFPGNKVVYLSARDTSSNNTGWQALGTWGVPGPQTAGPAVGGVSPARSDLAVQTYTFTFTDTNGWQDITVANILINSAIDGRQACYLAFVPTASAAGSLFLVDDSGEAAGPYSGMVLPGPPAGPGSVGNLQCAVSGTGASASGSGNTLTLTLPITFYPTFAGNKVFFLAARNNAVNTNWQAVGSVAVP